MYGKHFESMYDGSMYGSGVAVFAVWGYVISHTREGRIELNSRKLADTLGGEVKEIEDAIAFLEKPDAESRQKEHGGRRLLKEGEYQYAVPSWEHYQRLKNEADRREYNREAKRRERARKRPKSLPGEEAAVKAMANGDDDAADSITTAALPEARTQNRREEAPLAEGKTLCEVFAQEDLTREASKRGTEDPAPVSQPKPEQPVPFAGPAPRTPADAAEARSRPVGSDIEAEDDLGPEFD